MKRILASLFFSILLAAGAVAQSKKKDSLPVVTVPVPAGLRVGVDLSRFALKYFQPYRTDVTVNLDARYNDRLYIASDLSFNSVYHLDQNYKYISNGMSGTIGINYNFLKKNVPKENFIVYGGIRYGLAVFTYKIPEYRIYNVYWGNIRGSVPETTKMAHWVELTVGMKVEVLKNLYLGWSLHERILVNGALAKQDFPPLVIPGFGKGYKKSAFDFQYSIAYLIPLWKVKQAVSL